MAASATTTADGSYSATIKPVASAKLLTRFVARNGLAAASAAEIPVTVSVRTTAVTATSSATEVMAGAPVTVTGVLTQSAGAGTAPMPSTAVRVTYPLAGGRTATASASTNASGAYSVVVRPTGSGTVTVSYAGKVGWAPATASRALTVNEWTSSLTMSATRNASTGMVTVTGSLTVTDKAGAVTPKASSVVKVTYQATATTTRTVSATTKTSGVFTVLVKPLATGPVSAQYAGVPGWSAATAAPVTITVP